jgi:integrase
MAKRYFGSIRKLPSGRFQARYTGPDGLTYNAPVTFETRGDAEAWTAMRQSEVLREEWLPAKAPKRQSTILRHYATDWIGAREIKPKTQSHYQQLLDDHVLPMLGDSPIASITPQLVRTWHAKLGKLGQPTMRAHAYGLLRTIMGTAVSDGLIPTNPCQIRGAGTASRVIKIRAASLTELQTIVTTVPDRYRMLILLAAWCALRFGELTELRQKDIDLDKRVIHVQRGVVRVDGKAIVGTPKSEAGIRDVAIPPHLIELLREHISIHAEPGPDGLLFPARSGSHLAQASLAKVFYRARKAAGRDDLRFHDLRHTGAVLAAATGATLAELMARLGHTTPAAAMRYQHAAADRDQAIAAALSELATAT